MLIGLDCETTGLDLWRHPIIQIGLWKGDGEPFTSDIGWQEYEYDPEALAINGFTHDRIRSGSEAAKVDLAAVQYLEDQPKTIKMVGWNVGNFDAPRVSKVLPGLFTRFFHQVIELNTAVVIVSLVTGISEKKIKEDAKFYASEKIGTPPKWHDAGYDAQASLLAWEFMSNLMMFIKKFNDPDRGV